MSTSKVTTVTKQYAACGITDLKEFQHLAWLVDWVVLLQFSAHPSGTLWGPSQSCFHLHMQILKKTFPSIVWMRNSCFTFILIVLLERWKEPYAWSLNCSLNLICMKIVKKHPFCIHEFNLRKVIKSLSAWNGISLIQNYYLFILL